MAKKVTIYDIADRLNLSPSTVSRALAGNTLINAKTMTKVTETAKEMGYTDARYISSSLPLLHAKPSVLLPPAAYCPHRIHSG